MFLLLAAVLPVILLCFYIYKKDINKEPKGMLAKIFIFGMLICIPVIILELLVGSVIDPQESDSIIYIFIGTFISIAFIEELFKWFVVRGFGYNSKNFDEIYDIIVYAVFTSLGFACLENIGYVVQNGFGVAVLRALLSVPGHMCDGVLMGYFLSKAKVNSLNGNNALAKKNMILSLIVPTIAHTIFDACLTAGSFYILVFFVFHIALTIYCFITVNKISKIQQNITSNVKEGNIVGDTQGNVMYNTSSIIGEQKEVNFCPICGRSVKGFNFCPSCGFKLKK